MFPFAAQICFSCIYEELEIFTDIVVEYLNQYIKKYVSCI